MAKLQKRPAEAWTYVLMGDRSLPIEQQTTFLLKPLTHAERAAIRDSLARRQTSADGSFYTATRTRQQGYELCLSHIVSIQNFPVGSPQSWPSGQDARAQYLEQLDDEDVLEVGNEIFARSALMATEAEPLGNSLPPAATSGSGGGSPAITTTG